MNQISYPNQKRITIQKTVSDRAHPYSIFNIGALEFAMKTLKNDSFKLWSYLNMNQNGFQFYLSKADCNASGIKNYHNAVNDLIAKGFLRDDGGNHYTFLENPLEQSRQQPQIRQAPDDQDETPMLFPWQEPGQEDKGQRFKYTPQKSGFGGILGV